MSAIIKINGLSVQTEGVLPENDQWKNRFEIHSATSNRVYIIAQNKKTEKWGCSCPAYRTRRYCKHLMNGCGLPASKIHGNGQITAPKRGKALS